MKFIHLRRVKGGVVQATGGATVAISTDDTGFVKCGVARCGKSELFNKEIGRNVAGGRLKKNAYTVGLVEDDRELEYFHFKNEELSNAQIFNKARQIVASKYKRMGFA